MGGLNPSLTALVLLGLSAVASAPGAAAGTASTSVTIRGSVISDGTSYGAFSTVSNDPLVTAPDTPGPGSTNTGIDVPAPNGDYVGFQAYYFSLGGPDAVIFQTALINPYATYTQLVVKDVSGDPTKAPLTLEWTLPSLDTSTISFEDGTDNLVAHEPAVYDTSNLYAESFKFSRLSTDDFKYSGSIVFYDPVINSRLDALTVGGEVSVSPEYGGLLVADSDSFVLRGDTNSLGTSMSSDGLLITGKANSTSFVTGPIPEPTTWSLMILGLGAAGAALRRRPPRSAALRAAAQRA